MREVISYSGGLGSIVSALVAKEAGIDATLVFADTLVEHGDVYNSILEIIEATGFEFVYLCDGRTPWDVFIDERFVGNSRKAPCSKILKTRPVKAWMKSRFKPGEARLNLGMDLSEMDRIERAQKVWAPFEVGSFLIRHKAYRPGWPALLEKYGITTPALYGEGFPHNNCGGACVRAWLTQWVTVLEKKMPDLYAHNESEEGRSLTAIGPTARPFLLSRVGGEKEYLTLRKFREMHEEGKVTVSPFDYGGCGCFID